MSIKSSRAILVFALALVGTACGRKGAESPSGAARPSVILVTVDAIAPRHLKPFGGPRVMPKLEAVAASGTSYDDVMTTSPVARPALVTILTGACPDRSGVRDNIHDALTGSTTSVAELAQKSGFETAAFVSTPFASYASGLQRGFDLFDGPEESIIGPSQHHPPVVAAGAVAGHFKQWLASRTPGKPIFAWVHLADLNGAVPIPPESVGSSVKRSGDPLEDYERELGVVDEAVGTITAALQADAGARNAMVVIVGTHGVYLGEGGRFGDAFWLADETLRVPLIRLTHLSDPAATPPKHDPRPTWLPDVAATLMRAVSSELPKGQDGVSLDDAPPAGRLRLAWSFAPDDQLAWPPLTAVKEGSALSVFSAASDGQLQPVGDVSPSAAAAAATRAALPRRRVLTDALRDAATRAGAKLGTGGYHASPPKDAEAWLRDLQIDRWFLAHRRPQLAARQARDLLARAPDALAVLLIRTYMLSAQPSDELTEVRDKLLSLYPDRSEALHWSAHVSLMTKDYARAAALLDTAIAVGPVEPEMYYDRACVHVLQGDVKAGLAALETALSAGYRNWEWMDKDPDLAAVRSNPEFVALLKTHGR